MTLRQMKIKLGVLLLFWLSEIMDWRSSQVGGVCVPAAATSSAFEPGVFCTNGVTLLQTSVRPFSTQLGDIFAERPPVPKVEKLGCGCGAGIEFLFDHGGVHIQAKHRAGKTFGPVVFGARQIGIKWQRACGDGQIAQQVAQHQPRGEIEIGAALRAVAGFLRFDVAQPLHESCGKFAIIQRKANAGFCGHFGKLLGMGAAAAPQRRNVTIDEVGNVAAFMLSDLASGMTAEISYVDCGFSSTAGVSRDSAQIV